MSKKGKHRPRRPLGHSSELDAFLTKWSAPGARPGGSVNDPGWWHLRPLSASEFRSNQRMVGVGLLATALLVPLAAVIFQGGVSRLQSSDWIFVGTLSGLAAASG